MAVIVQTDIEPFIGRTFDTPSDPTVAAYIASATAIVEAEIRTPIEEASGIVAALNGNASDRLYLPRWPATAVAALTVDGEAWTEDVDFALYPTWGYLEAIDPQYWTPGRKNVAVTYTAGWNPVPEALKTTVAQIAANLYLSAAGIGPSDDGIEEKSVGGVSYQYVRLEGGALTSSMAALLRPYRRRLANLPIR